MKKFFNWIVSVFYPEVLLSPCKMYLLFVSTRNMPKHTNFRVTQPFSQICIHILLLWSKNTKKKKFFPKVKGFKNKTTTKKNKTKQNKTKQNKTKQNKQTKKKKKKKKNAYIFPCKNKSEKGLCNPKIHVWDQFHLNYSFMHAPVLEI